MYAPQNISKEIYFGNILRRYFENNAACAAEMGIMQMNVKRKSASLLILIFSVCFLIPVRCYANCQMEDIIKYQTTGSVCGFSAEDFIDAYSNSENKPIASVKIESLPPEAHGTLLLMGNPVSKDTQITSDLLSELSFRPSENFSGEVSFEISATDDFSVSPNSNVKIIYSDDIASEIPITAPFNIVCSKNGSVNDTLKYQYTGKEKLTYTIVSYPEKGKVEITGENGEFSYTAFQDQTGTDSFSFRVNSPAGESNISTCTVAVIESENDPLPTSQPLSFVYRDMVTHWGNYSAVKMVEAGVMKGERIGSKYYFYPDKTLTRLDCINYVLASLYVESDDIPDNMHIFADSDKYDDYVNLAAAKAYDLGIIEGSVGEDGQLYLNPFAPVKRVELIKMLDAAIGDKINSRASLSFADSGIIPEWAVQHIQNMLGYGIIQGYDDNTLRPFNNVTKAEATEMLYQTVKYNSSETTAKNILSKFSRLS